MGDDMPKVVPYPWTKEELLERQYQKAFKELRIARTRAGVVRNQLLNAYEILENIRFDFLGDTAFRDKIVKSKQNIEAAVDDFLVSDSYWEERIKEHHLLTPEEYDKKIKDTAVQQGQGVKK